MIVQTKNTTYELLNGKIRWIETKNPGNDTGITNKFRAFADIVGPEVGRQMIISWPIKKGERWFRHTTTTRVLSIDDDEPEFGWVK